MFATVKCRRWWFVVWLNDACHAVAPNETPQKTIKNFTRFKKWYLKAFMGTVVLSSADDAVLTTKDSAYRST